VIAAEDGRMQRDDWYVSQRSRAIFPSRKRSATMPEGGRLRAREPQDPDGQGAGPFRGAGGQRLALELRLRGERGSLYRKASFLLDSLGKEVFSPIVTSSSGRTSRADRRAPGSTTRRRDPRRDV